MHSHVQQRIQETVRHLKKGIVTRCVCAPVPVRYRGLACGFRPVKHSFSIGKLTGARQHRWLSVGEAVDSLDCNLVSLYVMLCEYVKEAVTCLIAVLEQHKFIVLLKGMRDILSSSTCSMSPCRLKASPSSRSRSS
jgi:hypothetical protein